jgi:hypothetical protein
MQVAECFVYSYWWRCLAAWSQSRWWLVFNGAWSLLCHYWSAEFASLFSLRENTIPQFRKCHEKRTKEE